jgi:type II secretory pathway component PulJ
MSEAIDELEADLGRKLTQLEKHLTTIGFLKGHSKGHAEATHEAIKLINKK